jgi:L-alanine-DL-glutamate epimerase-like enolase superfamily enzyme
MADLCKTTLPIALDEELIGCLKWKIKIIITKTMPQYIILKPSFIGGFRGTQEWISLAEKHHIVVDVV